jgi:hypothetical protein
MQRWRLNSMRNPQDFKIRCSAIGKIMSNSKKPNELSQTCKSFLHEWYANDDEPIHSKYIDKGNWVEDDLIDFAATQLGLGILTKNKESRSDEYFIGTCDVATDDTIIDVKASWNVTTLLKQITEGIDTDYEWQLRGYMHLYNRSKAVLFFGLMDTPADVNYGVDVTYDLPDSERWVAYHIDADPTRIEQVIERVKQCRIYLEGYDAIIKSKLGRVLL